MFFTSKSLFLLPILFLLQIYCCMRVEYYKAESTRTTMATTTSTPRNFSYIFDSVEMQAAMSILHQGGARRCNAKSFSARSESVFSNGKLAVVQANFELGYTFSQPNSFFRRANFPNYVVRHDAYLNSMRHEGGV